MSIINTTLFKPCSDVGTNKKKYLKAPMLWKNEAMINYVKDMWSV